MAITYSSSPGTHVTTHAVAETGISQSDQINNNTVIVSDSYTSTENGQSGDGTNGIGLSYVGRLIIINRGASDVQIRRCVSEVATGTGTLYRLTVHEDWDVNPVAGDSVGIPYELADIEDGTASGGIGFTARTGYFTLSNDLTIDSDGGLQMLDGTATELDDNSSAATMINASGGYFYSGYQAGDEYINGGLMLTVNNVTGEPIYDFQAGCKGYVYDMLFWAQLVDSLCTHASTAKMEFYGSKWLNGTNENLLYDAKVVDGKAYGKGATTSIVRVDAGTVVDGLVLATIHALDSAADTITETLNNLERITFSNTTNILTVRQNKTWYLIDPNWSVTDYTDLDWNGTSTLCYVYDQRSVKAIVQESDGTKLQNALINIYENTQLADLVVEITTDVNGYAEDAFAYKYHETNSATTTYGGHALQAGKWLYLPFVSTQASTDKFNGSIVLNPDSNIVQTTQATALSDGSGIIWNEDTNPSSIIKFAGGSGGTIGLAVGDTITGATSTADGIVTEILDGDGVAGTIHLKTRDAIGFSAEETIGNGADGWTATFTTGTQQDFSIWIDANTKSFQANYDYFAAKQTETTLSVDGELIWEWCRSAQTQPLYSTGSSFYTEQSNSKGIIIVNGGAGSIDYFTDDTNNTYVPPTSVTVEAIVLDNSTGLAIGTSARVQLMKTSDKTVIMSKATDAAGSASIPYSYIGDVPVTGWAREFNLAGDDYVQKDFTGTINSSGLSITVRLNPI